MLRESVIVKTATTNLHGELFVGADGLPEINVEVNDSWGKVRHYHQTLFPAAWCVLSVGGRAHGALLQAWIDIADIRSMIVDAQREADTEEQREPEVPHG